MDTLVREHYNREKERLMTIPGISTLAAIIILAGTGAEMEVFYSSNKFARWTGLRPRNDESAGKYKSRVPRKATLSPFHIGAGGMDGQLDEGFLFQEKVQSPYYQ
jgi:transposase